MYNAGGEHHIKARECSNTSTFRILFLKITTKRGKKGANSISS